MDAGPFDAGIDSWRDVAVSDEFDTGTGTAALVDDFLMARPVKDDDGQIVDASFQTFCNAAQVFLYRFGQIDAPFRPRADTELFHIHIRSMEQVPLAGDSHDGNGPILAFRRQVRPFQRVDSDIDFRTAGANFFTDIEHRRFIHFPFADDNSPINRYCRQNRMHAVHRQLVSAHLVAFPHEAAGFDGSRFGNTDKFQGQYAIHDEPPYLKKNRNTYIILLLDRAKKLLPHGRSFFRSSFVAGGRG